MALDCPEHPDVFRYKGSMSLWHISNIDVPKSSALDTVLTQECLISSAVDILVLTRSVMLPTQYNKSSLDFPSGCNQFTAVFILISCTLYPLRCSSVCLKLMVFEGIEAL